MTLLPSLESMNLPISWTDSEIELLEGSEVHTHTIRLKEELPEDFEKIRKIVDLPEDFDTFKWAWCIYSSRVMSLTRETSEKIFAVVPGLDMFNHSPSVPTGLFQLSKDHTVVVRAGDDLSAGQQAFINYSGDMNNSQMILSFGFMLDDMSLESCEITLSLQVSKAQKEVHRQVLDAFGPAKSFEILHFPRDLPGDHELIVKHVLTLGDPLPPAFLSMVRIQHLSDVASALNGLQAALELRALFLISTLLESKKEELQESLQKAEASHSLAWRQNMSEQKVLKGSLAEANRLQFLTIQTSLKSMSSRRGRSENPDLASPWLGRLRAASEELQTEVSSVARLSQNLMDFLRLQDLLQACHLLNLWMVGFHDKVIAQDELRKRLLLAVETWPFEGSGSAGYSEGPLHQEAPSSDSSSHTWETLGLEKVNEVTSDELKEPNPFLSLYCEKMSLWGSWLCAQWLHCEAMQLQDWNSMGQEQVSIRNEYAWSVPTANALSLLAKHQPLLELGAGAGYWASLLKRMSVDILAVDEKYFQTSFNEKAKISEGQEISFKYYCEVLQGGPEVASKYEDRSLVLMWPDYSGFGSYALECLQHYQGQKLILIGEWSNSTFGAYARGISKHGQSFSLEFQSKVEENFQLVEALNLPTWPLFLDRLQVFEKTRPSCYRCA